ncbi:ABC transporter permease subunit [Lactobacillus panisapium]|uniref:ABC transporter permease n=1 Tax=Lactobacillus panisapium TaxID=2012495 RepID=UPI001C6A76EA|nr:ABC transporter permease [Lactobacillus panisapium]QYN59345.1 ABC transporter permease subunit [Lactobacillus panisapium]
MGKSLEEEVYKFNHEKISLYGLLVLFFAMLYNIVSGKTIERSNLSYGFGAIEWIPLIIIAVGSAFFAMEYKNRTILTMLYKSTSKLKIYLAKFLVIFIYSVVLTVVAILLTFLFSFLFTGHKYDWIATINGHSLIFDLLINMLGAIIYSFFITGLSFMLCMLTRNNAVVVCIGIVLAFFGAGFSGALMRSFPEAVSIIKWNPMSIIFISQQLTRTSLISTSHLLDSELIIANIAYGLIFVVFGYYLFKNRRV